LPVTVVVDAVADLGIGRGDGALSEFTREPVTVLELSVALQRIAVMIQIAGGFVRYRQEGVGASFRAAAVVVFLLVPRAAVAGRGGIAGERSLVPGGGVYLVAFLPADVVLVGVPVAVVVHLVADL
jgi:hypothetical protein